MNKYVIKLDNKIISKRNTQRIYNYVWVRVVQREEEILEKLKKQKETQMDFGVYKMEERRVSLLRYGRLIATISKHWA